MKQMMTNKMKRRIKRRLKSTGSPQEDGSVDKEVVTSPPRLRRDSSVNNIAAAAAVAVSTNTGEIAFQLEDSSSPVIETFGFGGSSISTLTNDKAFTQKRFDCGFDSEEYAIMNQGSQPTSTISEDQRQLMMNGEKPYLQLQTDGKESGVGCISFGSKNKNNQQQPDSSPIAVNDMDFFNHFDNFDSNTIGSKAIANNNGSSSSAHKADVGLMTPTPRRNSKKDDDTFFYSQSEAPSSSNCSSSKLAGESITLASSKLAGESITLASSLSSVRHNNNMNSFDAINDDKLKTLFAEESMKERSRLDATTYQMGMSRREYHMKGEDLAPSLPSSRYSANYREKSKQQQEVQNVPRPTTTKESSAPRSSRKSCTRSKKHDIMKRDKSWSSSIDSGGSRSSGCGAPPEIVEEIVADVKTVLSSVISTVFLACSESEQCLSRCQHNKPTKTKATGLNSIDEEEFAASPVQESSSFIVTEETTGCKPWPGCLNLSPTDETEDVSDVFTPQKEVEYTVDRKQRRPRLVRLKKFLTSPLRRK